MRFSSRPALWVVFAMALSMVGLGGSPAVSEPTGDERMDVVISDARADGNDPFAVPNGSPTELLAFIEKLARPQQQFANQSELEKYLDPASRAIGEAADRILASTEATDQQLIDAIEWKLESLRIRRELGEADADERAEKFLAGLEFGDRPALADSVRQIRTDHALRRQREAQNRALMPVQREIALKLREWNQLDEGQRAAAVDQLIAGIKAAGPSPAAVELVFRVGDILSEPPDNGLAARAIDQLLPEFRASDDPAIERALPLLEGLARRLTLLGSKLELSGKFLDGREIDWDSYRGKVVLVDFWATWCDPCLAEVPNILENYKKYHDKGFDVVGICLDDNRQDPEKFIAQAKIPWPSLFDDSGMNNPMAVKYGITGIPTAILVDQQGKVVNVQARGPVLGMELERLLGPPAADRSSALERADRAARTAQTGQP